MNQKKRAQRIHIVINPSLNDQLSRAAKRSRVTKSAFIRVALERELTRDRELESEIAAREILPG